VQHVPVAALFSCAGIDADGACPYRRCMSQFSESAFQDSGEGPSFLSRVGIAFVLFTAGIGLALFLSAA